MPRFGRFIFSIAALLVIAAASSSVRADTINIVGVDSGQFSTAQSFVSSTRKQIHSLLQSRILQPSRQPGSTSTITGIGFDLPPLGNASASGLNGFTGTQAPSLSSNFVFSDGDFGNVPHGFNTCGAGLRVSSPVIQATSMVDR